ncbi:hypothetical protein BROC_02279 [Candidatus Brocadiaceae bacterium]|nr:hypothetical protein BROC_02279 [Candidatus Brocadiaceae bacterium]
MQGINLSHGQYNWSNLRLKSYVDELPLRHSYTNRLNRHSRLNVTEQVASRSCILRSTFLGLAFKLIEEAEKSWRKIRGTDRIELLLKGGFPSKAVN